MNTNILTDLTPIYLSLKLASMTTVILFFLGLPLAWWLSQSRSVFKTVIESVVALPLVLPPTVLGFYLLVTLNTHGIIGGFWHSLTGSSLAFSFSGLVVGSMIYSLPFVVQPLQNAFEGVDKQLVEAAQTLRASKFRIFFQIILPLSRRGLLSSAVLGFAHTLGEFGVVLMIGGNIPGKTQVISIALFDHVEQLQYHQANVISALLLSFSFIVLISLYTINRRYQYLRL